MPNTGSECVLLVEGADDEHVVRQLCRRYEEFPAFSVKVTGNDAKLLDAIGPALIVPGRRAVGVLTDADDDLQSRWNELSLRFVEEGINTPEVPDSGGTIMETEDGLHIGIWVMPDNASTGETEDFIQRMIPVGDMVWPMAQSYVGGIPPELRRFRPGKLRRAQVYAWLPTREIPGRMGAAIGAEDLDSKEENCAKFANWLRELFR